MLRLALTVLAACVTASLIAASPAHAEKPRTIAQPYDCDESRRGVQETVVVDGYYWVIVHCAGAGQPLQRQGESIPADNPTPGVIHENGERLGAYKGDRNISGGREGPSTNRDRVNDVRYQATTNHRAVQDDGGHCYREWRAGGVWKRSTSYGVGDEPCRRAAWNAYQRSQRLSLYNPYGTFPEGDPPD